MHHVCFANQREFSASIFNLYPAIVPFACFDYDFAIILSDCNGKTTARTASRLSSTISSHEFKDAAGLSLGNITIACGIANYRDNMQALFNDAGKTLTMAQKTGEQIAVAPTL